MLGALVALGPLTIDMYLPALPKIADDLSVSSSVVQLTLTGTLAGLALGQLIVGPLSDSLGRRRPLMAGIVLHMVASVVCLFAPNIVVLGLARGAAGRRRRRGDGGRDRRRRRSVRRLGRRHGDVAADAGAGRGAGGGAVAGRRGAAARVVALGLRRAGGAGRRAAAAGRAGAARDAAAVAPQAAAGARHRRHLRGTAARRAVRHPGARRRAGDVGSVRLHRGCVVRPAGPVRARPAGVRAGVRRGRGRPDRRHAVQRRAAEAVLAADDRAVGAGGGARWPASSSSVCPSRTSAGWPGSWCRCGRSWPRWAWSFPTPRRSRCPGIPTPRAPRPRCWAPRSSVSARRSPRWSACSATTSSRCPSS